MPVLVRWILGVAIAALVTVVPLLHFRWVYTHSKRLREVTPGVLYRSGQLTADGFAEAVTRYGIRTIVNLQDEYEDPEVSCCYFSTATVLETQLCRQLGVRYVHIAPDVLPRRLVPAQRPTAIEAFLAVMDDPASFPVLIHCRAGLHRTGVMTAVYRMEYRGWTARQALQELKANGFGEFPCTSANDYIMQYILTYRRGMRRGSDTVTR